MNNAKNRRIELKLNSIKPLRRTLFIFTLPLDQSQIQHHHNYTWFSQDLFMLLISSNKLNYQ